jgi:hypothetical protein
MITIFDSSLLIKYDKNFLHFKRLHTNCQQTTKMLFDDPLQPRSVRLDAGKKIVMALG